MTRTLEWKIRLFLSEEDGTTKAKAVLDTGTTTLTGHGTAHRSPQDLDVPEIGDDLAAGRAMHSLARQLMKTADRELEAMGAGPPAPGYGPYTAP
ncbi:dsRBD fold-containing protein [Streptomyces xantholiticus]|nr:hypothetical protein CGZ69_03005 [Streptomyces peucetius subsp. caesius ATCC 27952]